jgi:DNA-binding SARP family transcriptional activator
MLSLTTLGGLSASRPRADNTVAHLQRRRLALLAVLATGKRGISRDRLLLLLWPEADSESARNNLKQALFAIRRELGADALTGEAQEIRLNPEVWECDRWVFETALAGGAFDRAVAAYGGPFLDGFHISGEAEEFERWAEAERAGLATAHVEALEALATQADAASDWPTACRWWRRLATLDPLDSRFALGLMNALVLSGNSAAALQHARVHEDLVRQEAGIDPDPAVAALAAWIRSGRLTAPLGSTDAAPSARPAPGNVPSKATGNLQPSLTWGGLSGHDLRERLQAALAERYVIQEEVGRSGSAGPTRSYLARDERHGRTVILKVVHPLLASLLDVERFVREIGFTASLHHPHIVPLLESGQLDGRPWFSMPNVAGETLRERLTRDVSLPAHQALRLVGELADALDHAHRNGVVHRDVTPENIVLGEGHALLTNLGLARAIDAAATTRLTETGMLVGTVAYMSPEQASGEGAVDGRSDVYSLGCVLYEMLAGEPLHSGPTPQAIMAKRKVDPSPRLMNQAAIPAQVQPALLKALAVSPASRFASAGEFGVALSHVRPGPVLPSEQGRRSSRVLLTLGILAAILLLGWLISIFS